MIMPTNFSPAFRLLGATGMQRSFLLLTSFLFAACATQAPSTPENPASPLAIDKSLSLPPSEPKAQPAAQVAAPTPAQVTALRDWVSRQDRMYKVAAPLLINNTALCKRNARLLAGFTAKTRHSYSAEYASVAEQALGLDDRLRVMYILPGSGADRSGLVRGDILLSLQGKPMPAGKDAEREAALQVAAAMEDRKSINLTVLRDGRQVALDVPLTRACAIGVELGDADFVNSYADGSRVMITRGMLDYVQSDEELAYVLAKELAHAALAQGPRPAMTAAINGLVRYAPPAPQPKPAPGPLKPYSPVADSTADKLALYMLVRAGYSIDDTLGFWKRLAARYPASISNSHTELHPASTYRFSVMNAVATAIRAKQKNRMPLLP
mgnify:CR=1 FL=1